MTQIQYFDRVRVTIPTTGTSSPLTLGGAVLGFRSFADAGVPDGAVVPYTIEDEGAAQEVGYGAHNAGKLTRVVSSSSNANNPINLSGNAQLFIAPNAVALQPPILTPPAIAGVEHDYDPAGLVTAGGLRLSLSANGITLVTGIANGIAGRKLPITNLDPNHPLILVDQGDASWDRDNIIAENSAATNRFAFAALGSITINASETVTIQYDGTLQRWALLSRSDLPTRQEMGVRNRVINGRFQVWQRGTSFNDPGAGGGPQYTADRWLVNFRPSEGGAGTVSRVTLSPTESEQIDGNPPYAMQLWVTTAPSTNASTWAQRIGNVRSYANRPVTVSVWAKIIADPIGEGLNLALQLQQRFGSGGGASSPVTTQSFYYDRGLSSSGWVRYSWMFDVPSIDGKTIGNDGNDALEIQCSMRRRAQTIQLTSIQIEDGHQPTPIEVLDDSVVEEQCRYYYQRIGAASGATQGNANDVILMAPFEHMRLASPVLTTIAETTIKTVDSNHASTGISIVSSRIMPDGVSLNLTATSWSPPLNVPNLRPAITWSTTPWLELDAEIAA